MKYRKKPGIVEAEQCFYNQLPYPDGVQTLYVDILGRRYYDVNTDDSSIVGVDYHLVIRTLEGDHIVSDGDWIITGAKGEKYPCKPDIFALTYELVEKARE